MARTVPHTLLALLCLALLAVLGPLVEAAPKKLPKHENSLAIDAFHLDNVPRAIVKQVAGSTAANNRFGAEILTNITLEEATAIAADLSGPVINVLNNSTMQMCVSAIFSTLAGRNDAVTGVYPLAGKLDKSLPVPAGAIFRYDTSKAGLGKHNAKLLARWDCDKDCANCGFEKSHISGSPAVHTLYEYMVDPADPEGKLWENFSNVDGLSANYHRAVPGCPSRSSFVTAEQLQATCPASNTWHSGDVYGCISDCKRTNSAGHCCKDGMNDRKICPASSMFNKQLSPDAYAWAFDDAGNVDYCGKARVRNIAFSPIVPAGKDVTGIPPPADAPKQATSPVVQPDGLTHSLDAVAGNQSKVIAPRKYDMPPKGVMYCLCVLWPLLCPLMLVP